MKKKNLILLITSVTFGFGLFATSASAAIPEAKLDMMEEKIKLIENKLNNSQKLTEEKINSIITQKKEVVAKKKKAAEDKKKAEEAKKKEAEQAKAAAQAAANEAAAQQNNQVAAQEPAQGSTQGQTYTEPDVTTSASQSGREIGQRNREYGRQLSDPNLSQGERQQIIQEKRNYNRGRNR